MAYPPLAPTKRIWFRVKPTMLFVLLSRGCAPEKIKVSPVAGVPAKPQLPLSLQLLVVPPPDQLKVAPSLCRTPSIAQSAPAKQRKLVMGARFQSTVRVGIGFVCMLLRIASEFQLRCQGNSVGQLDALAIQCSAFHSLNLALCIAYERPYKT